jgi:TolA-binding protein
MMKSCAHLWKVDALDDGSLAASEATSLERHAKLCRECRDRIRLDLHLRGLAPHLPARVPEELPLRRLRARILSDAREVAVRSSSRLGRRWLLGAFALGAVLVVAFFARHGGSPDGAPFAGRVTPAPATQWSQARDAKLETVTLTQGELWIVVRKQAQGERFLVEVPDGELEVRGTTFDVRVGAGATRHVHVVEGVVAVELHGHAALELAAGQAWDLEAPDAEAVPKPASPATPPPSVSVARLPPPTVPLRAVVSPRPNTESADYEAVMKLYRGGRHEEAAAAFRQFAMRHRDSELKEDATFLEALSLTKAGHVDLGAVAAWRHLAEFPSSFHKKEASILVARAARDRGDCEEARRSLAPWLAAGGDLTIREALGACLEPSPERDLEPGTTR